MKIRLWLSVAAISSVVSMGCGGAGDTVEYQNAVITQNPDSTLTISDGQKESRFTTFQLEQGESSPDLPRSEMMEAACTCTNCGCSGTTCICTGCTGSCPKATAVAE